MTIFPPVGLGRNAYCKGPINYFAMAQQSATVGGVHVYDPKFRVSVDAKRWRKARLRGDIRNALRSDGPLGECFVPKKSICFKGRVILVGSLTKLSPSYQNRAAIYVGRGGYRFDRVSLPNDLLNPTGSGILDVAANDDYVVALGMNGVLYWWDGSGNPWQSRSDLPMGPSPTTNRHSAVVAITPAGGVVVGGSLSDAGGGAAGTARLISAASPSGAFAVRTLPTMNYLMMAAAGNVALVASGANPSGGQRIASSPLADLVNWSGAGVTLAGLIETMLYNGAAWIAAGGYNRIYLKSTAGGSGWATISDQAKTPWGDVLNERPIVNSAISVAGRFIAHWGHYSGDAGGVSLSDDGEAWQRFDGPASGLEAIPYILGAVTPVPDTAYRLDFAEPSNSQYYATVV